MDRAGEQVYHKRGRLKQLRAFCLTARLGNFSRAAEHLLTEPSAVSLQVRELEGELGAALLDRSRPSISLTPAGERFLRLCGPLVEAMDRLPDTFAEQLAIPASDLGVAADAIGTVFVLPELVRRFRDTRPGVGVRVRTGSLQEALALLRAGEVGLAFGAADPEAHDLLYHPIFLYEIVLVTQEDHPLAGRGPVSIEEAATGHVVTPDRNLYGGQLWEVVRRRLDGSGSVLVETSDWAALKSYVEQGFGIGVLPSACLTAGDRVSVVRLRGNFDEQSYGLYMRTDEPLSPAAAELVRIADSGPPPAARWADERVRRSSRDDGGGSGLDASSPEPPRPAAIPAPKPAYRRHDRLKQLRAFCHATSLRSMSRAAERVFSSQPVVSRQIRDLEHELGVELFERSGPHIMPSRTGEMLHRLARPLVEGIDRLPRAFAEQHGGASGALVIGAGETTAAFVLPESLKRFRVRHPETPVRIRIGGGQERLAWLRDYQVDLVAVSVEIPPPDLRFHELVRSEHVYITPEDHPLAGRESVELEEVCGYPAVLYPVGTYTRYLAETFARLHGAAPRIVAEADGWSAVKSCVEAGLGASIVPALCLQEQDRVWRIPFDRYVPPRRFGLLTRRDGLLSLSATRFMQAAGAGLDDAPADHVAEGPSG